MADESGDFGGVADGRTMEPAIAQRLLDLNRQFYEQFADPFAETRGPAQPGLLRVLDVLPMGRVLDVGCGNGRLAHVLEQAGRPVEVVGVDSSARLLAIARRQAATLTSVKATFLELDVTMPGWTSHLPVRPFQSVAMLALLHHLPGWRLRLAVLAALRSLLDPGGVMVVSAWQFLNEDRLRRKIVPWAAAGLQEDQVEPGDALLDWQRGGRGLRYCHWVSDAELVWLANAAGLVVADLFYADGRSRRLNLFGVLRPAPFDG